MKKAPRFLNVFFIIAVLASMLHCAPQKNIMESNTIQEIEAYLKTAHPEDPKRKLLHSKLIALKNAEWVKGAKDAKPMAARPIVAEVVQSLSVAGEAFQEREEYEKLLLETPLEHNNKTAQLLNTVFNTDIKNEDAVLLFKNNSDCNIILRIKGENFYNLPIPSHSENTVVVKQGKYTVESNICNIKYLSTKEIRKSQVIAITNSTIGDSKPAITQNTPNKVSQKSSTKKNKK